MTRKTYTADQLIPLTDVNDIIFNQVQTVDIADLVVTNAKLSADVARLNLLTNPGLEIWQRGAGPFTVNNAYTADRWQLSLGGTSTMSVSRDSANTDIGSQYCAACVYTHNTTSFLVQTIENYLGLQGRTITLSVRLKTSTANAVRVQISDSTVTIGGNYHTGGGAYETLTVTKTIGAGATFVTLGVRLDASCTVYVDNAVVVVGSVAADYQPLTPNDDMARCLRYYEVFGGRSVLEHITMLLCASATSAFGPLQYTKKAVTPTLSVSAVGDWAATNSTGAIVAATNVQFSFVTVDSCSVTITVAAGLTAGDASILVSNNTTAARLIIEANP